MSLAFFISTVILNTCFSVSICSSIPSLVENQILSGAVVEEKVVRTDLNQSALVLCKSPNSEPLHSCSWEKINSDHTVTTLNAPPTNHGEISPGYSYYGAGFSQGDCGITIQSIVSKDFGNWNCNIVTELCTTLTGTVQVVQLVKPNILNKPELRELQDVQNGTDKINVMCCIENDVHYNLTPGLRFQLGNESAPLEAAFQLNQHNLSTCLVWVDAIFTYQQNGLDLSCIATYASFPNASEKSDKVKLNIHFPPRVENLNGETRIKMSKLKEMFNITMLALANPYPDVKVIIQSKDEVAPKEITESSINEAFLIKVDNNISAGQVRIFIRLLDSGKVKNEDKITISVKNMLGKEEATFIFVADEIDIVDKLCIILFVVISILLGIIIIGIVVGVRSRRIHTGFYQVNRHEILNL